MGDIGGVHLIDANGLAFGTAGNPLNSAAQATLEGHAIGGTAFLTGTGNIAMSVAGNVRMTISNPAGSGKTVYIVRLSAFATAAAFGELLINPTAGLPVAARAVNNLLVGSAVAAVAQVKVDQSATTALSGGTDTGVAFAVPNGTMHIAELPPLVIPPGVTLGIAVPFAGAANASVNVYHYEV
jgi:hypothetical protein